MNVPDQLARDSALNINESFIIQAPAGSGKTSLLTQRYLGLLSKVNNPEEIVAITFTKKAAAEMQERIIESLLLAKEPPPQEPYLKKTYQLASEALKQNKHKQWNIFENKHRLRVLTIDAFCLFLTNRMPLLSKAIPFSLIADDANELYRNAAQQTLKTAENNAEYLPALEIIQGHLGNNQAQLVSLFVLMLQKREQWLAHVMSANALNRDYFEMVLADIQTQLCDLIIEQMPNGLMTQIESIIAYQAAHHSNPIYLEPGNFPWNNFKYIKALAELLISSSGTPRKRYTKKEGFPPVSAFSSTEDKHDAKLIKGSLKTISETLEDNNSLVLSLQQALLLPLAAYNDSQWHVLEALLVLLPLLAAELSILFSQTTQVDFSEISMQALQALGDDTPTELALYLDYEINHLLIDEFQDTSTKQFLLLERLTESWYEGDGKTLFLVGDPMQSIYRFREADVGLFLTIQHHGINQIKVTPLQLSCNFRSSASLINDVNRICEKIFPKQEKINDGAVTYAPSSTLNKDKEQAFYGLRCYDRDQEAHTIKNYIQAHSDETIAILIRSRSQLKKLVPILKDAGIAIEGINLENLNTSYLINLLLAITRFILNPDDALSLSAILLSPLCGLSPIELETLLFENKNNKSLSLSMLSNACNVLSKESQDRALTILNVFIHCQSHAYRQPIAKVSHFVWQHLNGDKLLTQKEQPDIEQFWRLLETHQQWPIDLALFERQLSTRYSQQHSECNVKIMTIHRAKGLEFDTVILPSVDYASIDKNTNLLNWLEIQNNTDLLLSPIHSAFDDKDPLVTYIKSIDKNKEWYERQRLFYVAITRAKTKLLLINSAKQDKKPTKNSFLHYLNSHILFEESTELNNSSRLQTNKTFSRLKQAYFFKNSEHSQKETANELPQQHRQSSQQIIGEFIHQQLFHIAENNVNPSIVCLTKNNKHQLLMQGLSPSFIQEALSTYQTCMENMQSCVTAKWILKNRPKADNELPLNTHKGNFIIDRTFIENNIRWIIDYKITKDINSNLESYKAQLNNYADLFYQINNKIKVKLMLYYPLLKHEITWENTIGHHEA